MSDQQRREECRKEVRGWLANRQRLAFTNETIRRRVNAEGNDFSQEQINDALVFLVGRKHVAMTPDGDGATPHYQATSEGVLAAEREGVA